MKKTTIFIFVCILSLLVPLTPAQVELSAKIIQRIADATPKSLPQSPRAPKPGTDADDEGLKGKVKTVVKENEDLSGTWSQQGRHFASITDFNEVGDFVKAVYFSSNGNPYEVKVYGYLDGTRVSLYQTIYEDSGIFTGAAPPSKASKVKAASDPRYSYKYEYKYIGGKLLEMQMILNNGEKGMRYVYNYTANQMEELAYGYDGKLNQKYITVYDSKGNEIEWHSIAIVNLPRPDRKYLIRTDTTDNRGNWTNRTFLKEVTDSGKISHEPAWTEYRKITYHSENKK